ncbi:MAG TPA: hypothetical protein EYP60_04370 [bacterium (Candidatus Stahlbacteria)]|nr:hypothetical protein [Candidatus Stahlbacteria bacterium]
MKKTEAVSNFLKTSISPIAKLYNPDMEVQVNVAKDNGIRIRGTFKGRNWRGWKDPETDEQWKSFRIPWNADTEPEYTDTRLNFDLAKHVEGIGMTGWDWKNKQSLWVGYDFDAIVTHDKGLSAEGLAELERKTSAIPWVTLLRSTGGKGIHLYLFFDKPIPTKNHTEHAAIARSLLSTLTIETGFNFSANVDTVGSVLWCYHRKQEGTQGLTFIKEGQKFPIAKIPKNWREHIGVCNRSKKKTHSGDKSIESLSSAMKSFFLEEMHLIILKWISDHAERDWWWDADYNMLICHTYDLKKCHTELKLRGIFETNSTGSSDQNCFAFPAKGGSFVVRRHGSRTAEARTWIIDESGWTKCMFNAEPSVHDACVTCDALENAKGEFVFANCKKVKQAMKLLNLKFNFPDHFKERQANIKVKGNKLIVMIEAEKGDAKVDGFLKEKKYWVKVLIYKEEHEEVPSQDTLVRHVISQKMEAGWYVSINDDWVFESKSNVVSVLVSQMVGYKRQEIEQMIGKSILDPWTLVNKPFEDEYLGGRQWNKDAAQLSIRPVQGKIEYWWDLLEHLGSGLDEAVQNNIWCQHNSITSGADYLFAWIAYMFQRPNEPLPYLFFFGEQKTGKSTLHEALSLLFKNKIGYARADQALKNISGFNSELAHSVLCVVEETDLSRNQLAANRIKDWVTGMTLSINTKHKNVYEIENTTHWIQCANDAKYCPIFRGDTRIVVVEVPTLEKEIPKQQFLQKLEDEISALLYDIIHYELPESEGRLQLPVIGTEVKSEIMADNFNPLEQFIQEKIYIKKGHLISFDEFYNTFQIWLAQNLPASQSDWSSRTTSLKLPKVPPMVKGQMGGDNKTYVGNVSFFNDVDDLDYEFILQKKRLVKVPRRS